MTRHKRERTVPVDRNHWLELRRADVTSTEVGALFGISPYMTRFELWHQKRSSGVVDVEPSERMQWGTRLQDAINFSECFLLVGNQVDNAIADDPVDGPRFDR